MTNNIRTSGAATLAYRIFGFPFVGRVLIITVLLSFTGNATAAREFGSGSDRFADLADYCRSYGAHEWVRVGLSGLADLLGLPGAADDHR